MARLFRLFGATERDSAIDEWLDAQPSPLGSMARFWFERLRVSGSDVRELMHDGCPTACVADAAFAYVNVFRAHVSVGFYQGAALPDPQRLLEGSGKLMRHVKLRPGVDMDQTALDALIQAAYVDVVARLAADQRDRETPLLL
jgi:hypothetical protein